MTIFCFIRSDCNKPLRMKTCCLNDPIKRNKSIYVVNARDLNTILHGHINHQSENKNAPFQMEVVLMMLLKLNKSFDIYGNAH